MKALAYILHELEMQQINRAQKENPRDYISSQFTTGVKNLPPFNGQLDDVIIWYKCSERIPY